MSGTFLIVDGTNLLMHSIHAVHYERSEPAGAALDVFMGMLGRHIREERPTRIAVCWDDTTSWRTTAWSGYKAARSSSIDPDAKGSAFALAKSFLHLLGVPNAAGPGLEADDVVAAFWRGAEGPAVDRLVILSGDGDFAQLVGQSPRDVFTIQIRPGKNPEWINSVDVYERYGCTPEDMPIFKALVGDNSDGIPGAKGIGPKRALTHIAGGLRTPEMVIAGLPVTQQDAVSLYLRLVDLRSGGPTYETPPRFVPLAPEHPRVQQAVELIKGYKLERLQSLLLTGDIWTPRQDYSFEVPSDLLAGR